MYITGLNFTGKTLTGKSNTIFEAENPALGSKIAPSFHEATQEEVGEAIQKANMAFKDYSRKSGPEKATFLEAIADEIMALGKALIQRCKEETGLPEARLNGERGRTVDQLCMFARLVREGCWVDARIEKADPSRDPAPKPDVRSMQRALGPVGIFGASNFPFAFSVAGGDTASALAAGCTVVVKAHPAHPGTCELVASAIIKAIEKCNLPDGTFSMVQGQSTSVGLAIVRHPLIKAIGFTGSFRGGKALFDEANARTEPIPVYAEMGSANPVIILPGALKERKESIAKDLTASVILGVGQFCTNPGLVFTERSEEEGSFRELLSNTIKEASSGVMLSGGLQQSYKRGLEKLSQTNGVTLLAEGKEEGQGYLGVPHVFQSTSESFFTDETLEEEVFGPSTLTVSVKDKQDLLKVIGKLKGHLTITVHGTDEDLKNYADVIRSLEQKAGRLIINGYPTGVEVCHAMVHGGPFPATTDSRTTSVGTTAITRFARPVCYQNFPGHLLPDELKDGNPLKIWRLMDGNLTKE